MPFIGGRVTKAKDVRSYHLQAVRDVIMKHTGVVPPQLPPQPPSEKYGRLALKQRVALLDALPVLAPGDGILAEVPERMEAYGQRRALPHSCPIPCL